MKPPNLVVESYYEAALIMSLFLLYDFTPQQKIGLILNVYSQIKAQDPDFNPPQPNGSN
jgi:hypothetical protein